MSQQWHSILNGFGELWKVISADERKHKLPEEHWRAAVQISELRAQVQSSTFKLSSSGHKPSWSILVLPFLNLWTGFFTAPFNNMRTFKFKAQPINAFFATVNQMLCGSSQLSTTAERAVIKSLSTVLGSSGKLGRAAEHLINKFVGWALNFRDRVVLKGAVNLLRLRLRCRLGRTRQRAHGHMMTVISRATDDWHFKLTDLVSGTSKERSYPWCLAHLSTFFGALELLPALINTMTWQDITRMSWITVSVSKPSLVL